MQQLIQKHNATRTSNIEAFVHYIYCIAYEYDGEKKAATQSLYNKNRMNLIQISKVCSAINTFT